MNAPEQLTFFEPTGDELAALVVTKLAAAQRAASRRELLELRGMTAVAAVYASIQALYERQADECAMCVDFERLAGLA